MIRNLIFFHLLKVSWRRKNYRRRPWKIIYNKLTVGSAQLIWTLFWFMVTSFLRRSSSIPFFEILLHFGWYIAYKMHYSSYIYYLQLLIQNKRVVESLSKTSTAEGYSYCLFALNCTYGYICSITAARHLLAPLHEFQYEQLNCDNLVDSSQLNWSWLWNNCSSPQFYKWKLWKSPNNFRNLQFLKT